MHLFTASVLGAFLSQKANEDGVKRHTYFSLRAASSLAYWIPLLRRVVRRKHVASQVPLEREHPTIR
jgi:hypothetical protein